MADVDTNPFAAASHSGHYSGARSGKGVEDYTILWACGFNGNGAEFLRKWRKMGIRAPLVLRDDLPNVAEFSALLVIG